MESHHDAQLNTDTPPSQITNWGFNVVRVAVGLVLLTAAGFKVHGLTLEPGFQHSLFASPQIQFATVALEIGLGLWLLSGWAMRASRLAALVFFSGLMLVSLYLALAGEPSCGCLGRVAVNPWWSFALDATAVTGLALWPPPRGANVPAVRWRPRLMVVGSGLALVWRKNADGSWIVTTHAFAALLTKNTCDQGMPTQTTQDIAWTSPVGTPNCSYTLPPQQTMAYVECDVPNHGDPPTVIATTQKRYVCAP